MKKIAIVGLGIEGLDAVKYFQKTGAEITVFDQKEKKELDFGGIARQGVKFVCGENYYLDGLSNYDVVVRSPGVYRYDPGIIAAEKQGVTITSAINIFLENCKGLVVGVTGTKGKGTTSTLIYKILKKSGKNVFLAGNIGVPFLSLLPKVTSDTIVVLELSSFQLIDLVKSPDIAVVLNITSDHLDWHKNRKEYIDAKKNILKRQSKKDMGVINADYTITKNFQGIGSGKKYFFSKNKKVKGSYVQRGNLYIDNNLIGSVNDFQLRGKHNWENITAAVMAARLSGASLSSIAESVFSFTGLEHRLEFVREVGGVKFYNDSFATGPQPTIAAVKSFTEQITLILGGSDKGLDYRKMANIITRQKNVKTIILIGQIRETIKKDLLRMGYKGRIIDLKKSDMKDIVTRAYRETGKKGVVILSPAAASFDMFLNYKDRGDKFKKAVMNLK